MTGEAPNERHCGWFFSSSNDRPSKPDVQGQRPRWIDFTQVVSEWNKRIENSVKD